MKLMIDNRYQVYLEQKTKLRLEMSMPLPDVDAIPVPMIYPFNIPVARNENIMSYAHLINPMSRTKVFNVTFYMTDIPVFNGKFYLKTLNEDYYRGSIIFNSFSEGFSEKKLNELVYADIVIGGTPHLIGNVTDHAKHVVMGNVEADYTFPVIFGNNFYGEPDDEGLTEYNPDWGGTGGYGIPAGRYINNFYAMIGEFMANSIQEDPLCDNVNSLVPCPFVHPLIRKIFTDEGFKSYGAFLDDTELQDLIIFFNYPLDEKYKKYFVRALYDESFNQTIPNGGAILQFPDDSGGELEDIDDCWNTTTYRYTVKNKGYHVFEAKVPAYANTDDGDNGIARLSLKDSSNNVLIYQDINISDAVWTDLSFELLYYLGNVYVNDTVYLHLKFVNQYGENKIGEVKDMSLVARNSSYQNLNQYSNILNIANHLPPVEIGPFVNALKKAFGLAVFFDFTTKEIEFSFIKDIIASSGFLDLSSNVLKKNKELEIPEVTGYNLKIDYDRDVFTYDNYEFLGEFDTYDDFPTPSEPNKIAIDKSSNTVNIYRRDTESATFKWFFYSDNIYDVEIGNGKEEITAEFSTLACHLGNDLLTAQTKAIASSPAFETGDNDFPLTLLFWRGQQLDENGNYYPMASSVNYDITGSSLGNYQIKMNGANGLYEKFLKPWYDLIQNSEEIKRNFICNTLDFLNIAKLFLPQKGTAIRKIRVDNMNCMPKKATFIFSSSGIDQAEIILIKPGGNDG